MRKGQKEMCLPFDDFETQRQSDEDDYSWFDEFNAWFESQIKPKYRVYEVQGSDDLIYEPIVEEDEVLPF